MRMARRCWRVKLSADGGARVPGLRRRLRPVSAVTIRARTRHAALALEGTITPIEPPQAANCL